MARYRLRANRTLFDTGETDINNLVYYKQTNVRWPVHAVDYNLLVALSVACDESGQFTVSGDPGPRGREEAIDAMDPVLRRNNEPVADWGAIYNDSQPDGGIWTPISERQWVHLTHEVGGVEGIAAAVYASVDEEGNVTTTWHVSEIAIEELE